MRAMRVLVIYFSRSGHTRELAEHLARRLRGTPMPITEHQSRAGVSGYVRSLLEALSGADVAIDPPREDLRSFDLVLIGGPVWASRPASPVATFVRRHRQRLGRVAFFCTAGGSGEERALATLERLLGRPAEATLSVTVDELDGHHPAAEARVQEFIGGLRLAVALPVRTVAPVARAA
jgi:menaquinone-dependent protoporphyrinogen IX oxidase